MPSTDPSEPIRTIEGLHLHEYDFLDFGAGTGNSIARCEQLFGGKGLGIEINHRKIQEAATLRRDVVYGDILALPGRKFVRYVSMDNFLEHLPDAETARQMVKVAGRVASEFIYIVHPSFEDEAYLRAIGLKQYWHDWTGHPTHLLLSDLVAMLRDAGATKLQLEYSGLTTDSSHPSILPIDAPKDQHDYEASKHGPKDIIEFAKPIYRQIRIRAFLRDDVSDESLGLRERLVELENRRAVRLADASWYLRQVRRPADLPAAYRRLKDALRT